MPITHRHRFPHGLPMRGNSHLIIDAKDIDRSAHITRLSSFLCLEPPPNFGAQPSPQIVTRGIYASTGVPPAGSVYTAMRRRARAFFPSLAASAILA